MVGRKNVMSSSFKNDHIYHGAKDMNSQRKFKTDQPSENQERVRKTLLNCTGCHKQA